MAINNNNKDSTALKANRLSFLSFLSINTRHALWLSSIGPIISGLFVYGILSIFDTPLRIAVPLTVAISIIMLGLSTYYGRGENLLHKTKRQTSSNKLISTFLFIVIYTTSVVLAFLSQDNIQFFVQWQNIAASGLMKLGFAIVICIFLPGYALISVICDRKSELEIGPDGFLYVVSYDYMCSPQIGKVISQGAIYRISPMTTSPSISNNTSAPANTSNNSRIIGNIMGITAVNNFSPQIKVDNNRILPVQNETHWSGPLRLNATYIEGSFTITGDKNETSKEMHAGLVWQEQSNKTYYAFVRPGDGLIVLADSVSEISCASLIAENVNSNKITIINSPESLYVYHNDLLRINVPREFNGTNISPVGIRTHNTESEFDSLKIGQFPQNLSQFLFPETIMTVNENKSINNNTKGYFH